MKNKTKYIVTFIIATIILSLFILYGINYFSNGNLKELKSNEVIEKIKNKEDFILCVAQTTCSHCEMYKPKLKKIANKYNILIYYINIDKLNKKEEKEFNKYIYTEGTPVTILFKKGEEETTANRIQGNASSKKVEETLKKYNFID